jgi:hypothetical protein
MHLDAVVTILHIHGTSVEGVEIQFSPKAFQLTRTRVIGRKSNNPKAFTCRSMVLYLIELLPFLLSPIFLDERMHERAELLGGRKPVGLVNCSRKILLPRLI